MERKNIVDIFLDFVHIFQKNKTKLFRNFLEKIIRWNGT